MAGPERITPLEVFPLKKDEVQEGINWVQSNLIYDVKRDHALENLKEKSPKLFHVTDNLKHLRNELQLQSERQAKAYDNGVLFMLNVMENKYKKIGMDLPYISSDLGQAYLLDLIDTENNAYEVNILTGSLPASKKKRTNNMHDIVTRLIDEQNTKLGKRLVNSFKQNSTHRFDAMDERETLLSEALASSTLIRVHGPSLGLHLGATDIYELFERKNSFKNFEKALDIEVK